jgi:hypothetical protein
LGAQAVAVTVAGEVRHVPSGLERHMLAVLLEFVATPAAAAATVAAEALDGEHAAIQRPSVPCGSVRVPVRRHLAFEVESALVLRAPTAGRWVHTHTWASGASVGSDASIEKLGIKCSLRSISRPLQP